MKNLLLGAILLFLFSISVVVIQTSCSKSNAQSPTSQEQINKIIYITRDRRIWTANYDGTNATTVNIALPPNILVDMQIPNMSVRLSPDGQKIFFNAIDTSSRDASTSGVFARSIYSCDISGSNAVPVIVQPPGQNMLDEPILCGAQ